MPQFQQPFVYWADTHIMPYFIACMWAAAIIVPFWIGSKHLKTEEYRKK